jgi:hypothetical protein
MLKSTVSRHWKVEMRKRKFGFCSNVTRTCSKNCCSYVCKMIQYWISDCQIGRSSHIHPMHCISSQIFFFLEIMLILSSNCIFNLYIKMKYILIPVNGKIFLWQHRKNTSLYLTTLTVITTEAPKENIFYVGWSPTSDISCHVYEWLQTGFRLVIGFIETL